MSEVKIKTSGKVIIIALVLGALFCGKIFWWDKRPQEHDQTISIEKMALPDAPESSFTGEALKLALPSDKPIATDGRTKITHKIMAWNSQFGWMYANAGQNTTEGSLFDKAKVNVSLVRQDDCGKSCADLVAFAKDLKDGKTNDGVFITFMGDGMSAYMTNLSNELKPLGDDYQPIIIMTSGKSYGEDKLMGPVEWRSDPKNAIGKCIATVIKDGDQNIVSQWASDNGLKVNFDPTTYDATAINFIAAANSDFVDAGNKYITGYTETRKIVKNGMTTGKDTIVGVDAVSSWSPVDVTIAKSKGGLVNIVSTKEYSTQMPNMTITIKKWAYDHRTDVENMIIALAQAGDQVRSFNDAKEFAGNVSADVYGEKQQGKDGAYWTKYYSGVEEKDVTGLKVTLGGSMVFNLQDMANTFGLGDDHIDRYKIVYERFGNILSKGYPKDLPTYLPYAKAIDKSFMLGVVSNHPELLKGKALSVEYAKTITKEVAHKTIQVLFETGSDKINPVSYDVLDDAFKSASIAENLKVGVYGYTDNVGNDDNNKELSVKRAKSVMKYLIEKGLKPERIESEGYGSANPVADNNTDSGRKLNRRVELVLGQ